jgi:hypothetical protein
MTVVNQDAVQDKPTLRSRLFSFATLCGVVTLMGYGGSGVYRIATDQFVAPCVLSPDSDLVISSKLSMAQLVGERFHASTRRDEIDVSVEAADKAIVELEELRASAARGLEFTAAMTAKQSSAGKNDLRALAEQRQSLVAMIAAQEAFLGQVKKDLEAGLAAKADYSRELQSLNQLKVALIENDRSRLVSEVTMNQVSLTEKALRTSKTPGSIATPEMLMLQDQLVRVTTDILKLRAERRSAIAEKSHLDEELKMIDQLMGQLKERPTFSAADGDLTVAFVPYTQMEGVEKGAKVYDCVWGLFACKPVGQVTKLLPGEVILPDPWGTMTRGQYATMDIADPAAAKSRTLRVRPQHLPATTKPTNETRIANAK